MTDHLRLEQDALAAQDPTEDYAAPALTDLGSFAELTQNSVAGAVDAEGMS